MAKKLSRFLMKYPDQRQPFYPWPGLLRSFGFSRSYILKDLFFKKEIERLRLIPGTKVLDVGCGRGLFLDRLASSFKVRGVGIDISSKAIKTAKKETSECQFILADATSLPFSKESFEAVFCLDTLEHIKKQNQVLGEMMRVLKPKGLLFIYAMNKNRQLTYKWFFIHFFKLIKIDAQQRVGHFPNLFLEKKKINNFLKKNKMRILAAKPFHSFFTNLFDFFVMVVFFLFSKGSFFRSEKLGKIVLTLTDFICQLVYYPLLILDLPWRALGKGNGLLFIAKKQ